MSIEIKVISGVAGMVFFLLFIVLWNIHEDLKVLKKIDFRLDGAVDNLKSMKNDTKFVLSCIDTQISHLGEDINEIYKSMFINSEVSIYRKENIVEENAEDRRIITRCHEALKNKDSLSPDQARRILEILQEDNE